MEDNRKLNRVFDRVKLSREREETLLADLLREKKEVLSMKQTTRRRVPAAALAAAVLAVVLAGTALAAYFGGITIDRYENGYKVQADLEPILQSSLAEDVLRRAESATGTAEILPFQSWDEAEAYLGLEIADNARLDQMNRHLYGLSLGADRESMVAPCLIWLDFYESLPSRIMLKASYEEDGFMVNVESVLLVENPVFREDSSYWYGKPSSEMAGTEWYVTPSGIETAIVTSQSADRDWTRYEAQFVLNQALFRVGIKVDNGESGEDALSLLKEVLDAYE